MRLRRAPLAVGMAGACGVGAAVLLGLFEPGWGLAASFPLLCFALAAGVVRDPDGPEVHVFLGCAMAVTAGFLVTHVAVVTSETRRAEARARDGYEDVVREETRRIHEEATPKWIAIASGVVVGGAVLAWRAARTRR